LKPNGRIAILNIARLLRVNQNAGRELGLEVVDEWWPSSSHFLLVLARPGSKDSEISGRCAAPGDT